MISIYKSKVILDTPEKIAIAIHNKSHVLIHQAGELLGFGGVIESQTGESVTINGYKYLKATCLFTIR